MLSTEAYSGISAPDIDCDILNRCTLAHIDDLDIQIQSHTGLSLCDILADWLSSDPLLPNQHTIANAACLPLQVDSRMTNRMVPL